MPPLIASNEHVIDAVATDIDADGDLDIVMTAGPWRAPSSGRVFRNDGSASFTLVTPASIALTTSNARSIQAGDFNADGLEDLLFGYYYQWPTTLGPGALLFMNDGTGQFAATSIGSSSFGPNRVHIEDFEGDGDLDFINDYAFSPTLQLNDGTGQFTELSLTTMAGSRLFPDDVDLDGDIDLWTDGAGWPTLYINDGNNNFTHGPARMDIEQAQHLASEFVLIDLDRDGDRDVVIVAENSYSSIQYYVPLWNHRSHLRAPHRTTIGGMLDLFVSAIEAPATPLAVVGVAASEAQIPTAFGLLGIDPASAFLITIPMSNGDGEIHIGVPSNNALLGMPLHAQALLITDSQLRLTGTVTSRIVP